MNKKAINNKIPEVLLQRLSEYLTARVGLHFAKRNWNELQQKMAAAMKEFDFNDVEEFVTWLISLSPTQKQIEILASHLTIGETYFFREKRAFEILEQYILPGLIDSRRKTEKRLRIWSAGCSTGEEPYSIAIMLKKMIPDLSEWTVTILATDINTGALRKAKEGIYSDWSFRDTPPFFKEKYFIKAEGNHYLLRPEIRRMVAFEYLNLSEDLYPSLQNNTNAMDVIFCRNVLMYFSPYQIGQAAERFSRSLLDGGWLITSSVETSLLIHSPFVTARFEDAIFYKKDIHEADRNAVKCAEKESCYGVPMALFPEIIKKRRSEKASLAPENRLLKKPLEPEQSPIEEATILYRNGKYQEAEQKLRRIMANGGKSQESVVLYAKILANQGRIDEALNCCDEALSSDKCNPRLHFLLANILEEQKRSEDARNSLKRAIYLDRNFILAHFSMANISLRLGKKAEARKHFGHTAEILSACKPDDIIPESEGITAGRLSEIISAIRLQELT